MAHNMRSRMARLELVRKIIQDLKPNLSDEGEVENLYDVVQWNTGCRRKTAEEYVRLVLRFANIS